MGRRRSRNRHDGGLVSAALAQLLQLARESPKVGLIISVILLAIARSLLQSTSKSTNGLEKLFGLIPLGVGLIVGVIALVSLLKHRFVPPPNAESAPQSDHGSETSGGFQRRDGQAFEREVAAFFRHQGYDVQEVGTHGTGGDRGIDLILRPPNAPNAQTVCVQCKDFAAWKVGAPAVRTFHGAIALCGPRHVGWIVTTGRFTADAIRDARQLEIRLIDGDSWKSMRATTGAPNPPTSTIAASSNTCAAPLCPTCQISMIRRSRRAHQKYAPFWGSRNYPRCRQTLEIA